MLKNHKGNVACPVAKQNDDMKMWSRIFASLASSLFVHTQFVAMALSPPSVRALRDGHVVGKLKTVLEEKGVRTADIPKAIAIHEW